MCTLVPCRKKSQKTLNHIGTVQNTERKRCFWPPNLFYPSFDLFHDLPIRSSNCFPFAPISRRVPFFSCGIAGTLPCSCGAGHESLGRGFNPADNTDLATAIQTRHSKGGLFLALTETSRLLSPLPLHKHACLCSSYLNDHLSSVITVNILLCSCVCATVGVSLSSTSQLHCTQSVLVPVGLLACLMS